MREQEKIRREAPRPGSQRENNLAREVLLEGLSSSGAI